LSFVVVEETLRIKQDNMKAIVVEETVRITQETFTATEQTMEGYTGDIVTYITGRRKLIALCRFDGWA
jgi:hypothetical protein